LSGLAEVGSLLGWAVAKHGASLLDLCLHTLSLERPANDDLFARAERPPPEQVVAAGNSSSGGSRSRSSSSSSSQLCAGSHHALAARRGAAYLARRLVDGCGRQLLHSDASCPSLHRLWRLLRDVSRGPGAARAPVTAAGDRRTAAPAEWSLETDPVVRVHLAHTLAAVNDLMLTELRLH
jgi:hypothetical protein